MTKKERKAYSLAVTRRRKYLFDRFDFTDKRVLELGALDMPTFEPDEAQVDYMDYYSDEEFAELAAQGALSRPLSSLVSVTHAVKNRHFSIHFDTKYDLVIAAHVIEHVPDMLTWLAEISQILTPNGSVFLAIPDRRYTLDFIRQETSPIEFFQRFNRQDKFPTLEAITDFLYNKRNIRAETVWADPDSLEELIGQREITLPQAFEQAKRALLSGAEHVNIHCSVFSCPTFSEVWQGISETGIVDLDLVQVGDVAINSNEFWVLLRKKGEVDPAKRRATKTRKFLTGKEGYLFLSNDTNDTVAQISGKSPLDKKTINQWFRLIKSRESLCDSYGAAYKFVIAPAKEVIYEKYLPDDVRVSDLRPALQLADHPQLAQLVDYPIEALWNVKDCTYPRDDTHWTDIGGLAVFQSIMSPFAEQLGLRLPKIEDFTKEFENRIGDLGVHAQATTPERLTKLKPVTKTWSVVSDNKQPNRGRLIITENPTVSTGTVVLFRDSFSEVLLEYFASTFSRFVAVWNPFVDFDLVENEKPSLVVNVMAERFLRVVPDDIHLFSWEEVEILENVRVT